MPKTRILDFSIAVLVVYFGPLFFFLAIRGFHVLSGVRRDYALNYGHVDVTLRPEEGASLR